MLGINLALHIALFGVSVTAVDIALFKNRVLGDCTNAQPDYICVSIAENTCCSQGRTVTYQATRFNDLPQNNKNINAIGANLIASSNTACGTVCNSGLGHPVLCLNACTSPVQSTYNGAYWVVPNMGKAKRDDENFDVHVDCHKPDLAVIDGKFFRINHNVSEEVTKKLMDLAEGGAKYADVPTELLEYENLTYVG